MAIDLHFRKSVLLPLVGHEPRKRLRAACIPPDATGQLFNDHLDINPSSSTISVNASRILFTVQFDAFMVPRTSLDPGTALGIIDPPEGLYGRLLTRHRGSR
ncbi:hypothetical protein QBC43DRAFT_289992 [Cladorrhinum sp. PSN259]|nr:hypothetical protein QBC43DRAFT_289992 [Cladorrhinum sp. PSN259]